MSLLYLEYLYEQTHHLYDKHRRCHRDLKNISIKIPPQKTEMSYVFQYDVKDVKEEKCDIEAIQEFFKSLKDVLRVFQDWINWLTFIYLLIILMKCTKIIILSLKIISINKIITKFNISKIVWHCTHKSQKSWVLASWLGIFHVLF